MLCNLKQSTVYFTSKDDVEAWRLQNITAHKAEVKSHILCQSEIWERFSFGIYQDMKQIHFTQGDKAV